MELINVKIDGIPVAVKKGSTILEAAREANIDIPTLCYLREINEIGACRICVVEVKGARSLVASCVYPVAEGMEIFTRTPKVLEARKMNLELLLSNHNQDCLACVRNNNCELQKLCREFGVTNSQYFDGEKQEFEIDDSAKHMYRDNSKCILCRRCVAVCSKNQDVSVIGCNERGYKTHVGCAFEKGLGETACVSCGQCIVACPTGALSEKDDTDKVFEAINDKTKHVIVQPAPSIRVTLGEEFGMPIGTDVTGKLAAVLRRLGFDRVYDTDFGADLTIVEEANELIERIKNGGKLPMITSCSPGWVNYMESFFPEFIPNISTCKSPQQMFGAIVKTWYAEKNNIDPKDIVVVGVMPCTAKKYEISRDDQNAAGPGIPDVDISITTRELARMIRKARINFENLPDEKFDDPLGISTGAGTIFGTSGGVMEAALRTAVETLTDNKVDKLDFEEVRGMKDIKKASYKVGDLEVKVAVASGLANARKLLELVKSGEEEFHFIEIMACPGGCINGGGQPIHPASERNFKDIRLERSKALYDQDKNTKIRRSHENPAIIKLYDEYLGEPGSHKAHEILHTSYKEKSRF